MPRRSDLRCDFCLRPGPRWSFPAPDNALALTDTDMHGLGYGPTVHISQGGWAACTRCAAIVRRQDVDRLAAVAAECGCERGTGIPWAALTAESQAALVDSLRALYRDVLPTLGERQVLRPEPGDGTGGVTVTDLGPGSAGNADRN